MNNTTLRVAILTFSATIAAHAGPMVISNPSNGVISGSPGDTIGWGFVISADPNKWISFVASIPLFESDPSVGSYLDLVGVQGGPVTAVLAPGSPDWVENFDLAAFTGLGLFTIDPLAVPGAGDSGVLRLLYASYSGDPNTCGSCGGTQGFVDVPFQVDVVATAVTNSPEPGSWWLCGIGGVLVVGRLVKRCRHGTLH